MLKNQGSRELQGEALLITDRTWVGRNFLLLKYL